MTPGEEDMCFALESRRDERRRRAFLRAARTV
jgi:hypothetical protein